MGRQIENAIFAATLEHLSEMGIRRLHAGYVSSGKNRPVEGLWERLGLALSEELGGGKRYEMTLPAKLDTLLSAVWE